MVNGFVFSKENDAHKDASFNRKAERVILKAAIVANTRFNQFFRQYAPVARATTRFYLPARKFMLAG